MLVPVPDYFIDVVARCALESAPACASLTYSPLFERFWAVSTNGRYH